MSMMKRQIEAMTVLVQEHHEVQVEIAELESRLNKIKSKLMDKLEEYELETIVLGDEGEGVKVTIVRPTTLKIDENGLQQALTNAQWKSITKQVIDKKALEDAVVRGKIDAVTVSDHTKEVASRPYLRITG